MMMMMDWTVKRKEKGGGRKEGRKGTISFEREIKVGSCIIRGYVDGWRMDGFGGTVICELHRASRSSLQQKNTDAKGNQIVERRGIKYLPIISSPRPRPRPPPRKSPKTPTSRSSNPPRASPATSESSSRP